MKTGGIVLIVLGSLMTLGGIKGIVSGYTTEFSLYAPGLIVLGTYLIVKKNKKVKEEEKKKNWAEGKTDGID